MKHLKPGLHAVSYPRPTGPAPTDTAPAGEPAPAAPAETAPAGTPTGVPGGGRDADAELLITPPAGAPGGSGQVATGAGSTSATAAAQQQQAAPAVPAPAEGTQRLEDQPQWVQDMVRDLRKEAGDHRIKAKTAEETVAERLKTEQTDLVKKMLAAAGLLPADAEAAAEMTPEQQVQTLTDQLGQRDQDATAREAAYREVAHELAIWRGAATHDADPQRLTDSVSFMRSVAGLDPASADFGEQVSAAIAAAVAANEQFKRPAAAQVAPPQPVASGADGFAGGPRGASNNEPKGVEAHRAAVRASRGQPIT